MMQGFSNGNSAVMAFFELNYKHVPLVRFLAERIKLKQWNPRTIDFLRLTPISDDDAWGVSVSKTDCFFIFKDKSSASFDIVHHTDGKFHVDITSYLVANQWKK